MHLSSVSLSRAGQDYQPVITTITFDSHDPVGAVNCAAVDILDDPIVEDEEVFNVELKPWTDQPILIGSPNNASVTILQDAADGKMSY